mmetsp:Transcript_109265/g.308256  ORF Transcript_109265/g.308256 Transcript_109265/m.308256 type:complete len:240 (+) Transcript_109265:538-1257(+)
MATPTSAWASASESFMPSPTKPTRFWPDLCNICTHSRLVDGNASATMAVPMPTFSAMHWAVAVLSPVHIHTSRPNVFFSCSTTHLASGRIGSLRATAPKATPSTWRITTVWPRSCKETTQERNSAAPGASGEFPTVSSKKRRLPTRAMTPPSWSTTQRTPRPLRHSKSSGVTIGGRPCILPTVPWMHFATGWSLALSRVPSNHQKHRSSSSVSATPSAPMNSTVAGANSLAAVVTEFLG